MRYISLLNCIQFCLFCNLFGQKRCDTLRTDMIFTVTEVSPKSNITYEELENLLNNNINIKEFEKPPGDMIYLTFTINCKGEAFDYKFFRSVDKKLQDNILGVIVNNMNWMPAQQSSRKVDFQKNISIKIEKNNKFNVLDEKEQKKIK